MTFSLTVPELGVGRKGSTKDLIIKVLSEEWPLAAKKIHARVQRNGTGNISYQAVHKTVLSLLKEGLIEKHPGGYKLSSEWIKGMKNFIEHLDTAYSSNTSKSFDSNKPLYLDFENIVEVGKFIVFKFHGSDFPNPKNLPNICLWKHNWPLIGLSDKEYTRCVELFKAEDYYSLVRCDSFLDKMFSGMLEKMGKKAKTGVSFSAQQDTFVHGNYVCQVFLPQEIMDEMDKAYSKITSFDEETLNSFFKDFLSKKVKINAIIFKSPELADKLRKETLKYFQETEKAKVEARK